MLNGSRKKMLIKTDVEERNDVDDPLRGAELINDLTEWLTGP